MKTPLEILKNQFHYDQFRSPQEEMIQALLEGKSVLGVLPTGFGKSLCFQVPAMILPGLTLVISPLIALMKDQVDQACRNGIPAAFINSSQSREDRDAVLKKIANGRVKVLYVTPERFRKEEFWEVLKGQEISLFVVDEAHCISEWGHDFRPDYTRLGEVRARLNRPVTLALTATATREVRADILKQLHLPESTSCFVTGVDRPNLDLQCVEVHGVAEKVRALFSFHHHVVGPKIIYFSLIQSLEEVSREISKLGVSHVVYHGQLSPAERRRMQNQFLRNEVDLMLATPDRKSVV